MSECVNGCLGFIRLPNELPGLGAPCRNLTRVPAQQGQAGGPLSAVTRRPGLLPFVGRGARGTSPEGDSVHHIR